MNMPKRNKSAGLKTSDSVLPQTLDTAINSDSALHSASDSALESASEINQV
jgi:hypothetical protein